MGVSTDKILGYRVNVMEEFKSLCKGLSEEQQDNLMCDIELLPNGQRLVEAGGVAQYGDGTPQKGNIVLLDDGMCASYCWLIYVEHYDYCSADETEENKPLNNLLGQMKIPNEIYCAIRDYYELLFQKPFGNKEILLQELKHCH